MIELLNVDCMTYMATLPDKAFDLAIVIACDIEGYDLTLCEIDADYFAAGKKRLEQHQSAPRLFDAPPNDHGTQLVMDPNPQVGS